MASTYTTGFGIEKIGSGEQSGTWGTTTNHNLDIIDRIASYKAVALSGTTHTLTVREASPGSGTENLQDGMYRVIKFTGALGANNTVTIAPNTAPAYFIIENATTDSGSSGPYSVVLSQGSGANVTVQNGKNAIVYCDGAGSGAAVVDALADLQVGTLEVTGAAAIDGAATLASTLAVTGAVTGSSTIQGTTITATTAFVPDASDGAALGTTSLEFSDLYLADGAVIGFGDDQDVTLTHVADTGLLLNSTMALQFNDASQYINAPSATILDINATDEIELNATLADVNANLDVSGTLTQAGASQFNSTVTIGVDDTGYDVKFFGATSGKYMLWDESADSLILVGNVGIGLTSPQTLVHIHDSGTGGSDLLRLTTGDTGSGSSDGFKVHYESDLDICYMNLEQGDHKWYTHNGSSVSDRMILSDAGNLSLTGDFSLKHDGAVLYFGADSDISLTHVADKGLVIESGSAGSVTASTDADELVLESSGNSGLSLLAAASSNAQIYFGEGTDNDAAFIQYNGSIDDLILSTTNSSSKLILKADAGVTQVTFDGAAGSQFAEFANDIGLKSDSSKLYFGADNDVTLTHVADTGLLLNSTREIQFRDSALKIYSSADGQLDLAADTEIELTAATVAVEGIFNVSSTSWLYDDVRIRHDGGVLYFGTDSEVSLTHVHDTGLTLNKNLTVTGEATFGPGGTGTDVVNIIANGGSGAAGGAVFEIRSNGTYRGGLGNEAAINGSGTSNDIHLRTASGADIVFAPNNVNSLTLASAGTATFAGAVTGTTAKFVTGTDANGFVISENANNDQAISLGVTGGSGSGTAYFKAFSGGSDSVDLIFQTANSGTEGTALTLLANNTANFASHVNLLSDGAVLSFGAGNDVTATHVHDVGLNFASTRSNADSIFRFSNSSDTSGSDIRLILQTGGTSGGDPLINFDGVASNATWSVGVDTSATKFVIADADKGGFDGSDEVFTIATGGAVSINSDAAIPLTITSTDAGAGIGPAINLHRNSASPADGDTIGVIYFNGEDDASNATTYAYISGTMGDVSNGSEDGQLNIIVNKAGTLASVATIKSTEFILNENGVDIDFRVESDGNANMLFVDGGNNKVGIGTGTSDGTLHVHTASAGSVAAESSSDDLIVENSDHGGMSVLTPDDKYGLVTFGSPSDAHGFLVDWSYDASLGRVHTSKVGASLELKADNSVANITLAGASGSQTATFAGNLVSGGSTVALMSSGSNSVPSFSFSSDVDTGMYKPASNTLGFTVGGAIKLRLDSDGLKFGSDTAAANALDDYEEGTWTPTLTGATTTGSSQSYSTQEGRYTKIGRLVFVAIHIDLASVGDAGGTARISLPMAVANTTGTHFGLTAVDSNAWDLGSGKSWFTGLCEENTSHVLVLAQGDDVGGGALTVADFGGTLMIKFSGCYEAA